MEPKVNISLDLLKQVWRSACTKSGYLGEGHAIDEMKKWSEEYCTPNDYAYGVHYPSLELIDLSNNASTFFGYKNKCTSLDFLYDVVHDQDLTTVIDHTKAHWIRGKKDPHTYFKEYNLYLSLDYRVKSKTNPNKRIQRIAGIGCSDESGLPVFTVQVMRDITFLKESNDICPYVFGAINEKVRLSHENSEWDKLSRRELEILNFLNEGLTSKEIANHLYVSVHTVDTHRRNMLNKMAFANTGAMLSAARKERII